MSHPVSQLWISCKDCFTFLQNERGQERHGNYINGFSERNLIVFKAIWSFWNKNGMASSSLWICSQVFLLILLKKREQEVHENFFSCFLWKNLFWGKLIFSSHSLMFDWVWSKLSRATATFGSLKSQDMISQVNVYVADSALRYYVMIVYGGQYSTQGYMVSWKSFFKNLLHNFVWM